MRRSAEAHGTVPSKRLGASLTISDMPPLSSNSREDRGRSCASGLSPDVCRASIPINPDMRDGATHLEHVGSVVEALTDLGLQPVLVGGMALVVIGSRRVTRDFDFVVAQPGARLQALLEVFYERGLQLVSRLNPEGDVTATIDNRRVAAARLRLDAPASAYFFNPETGLRIDLLFDFPIPAAALARHATRMTVRSRVLPIASEADLLRLKKIARANRSAPGDAEDIAFLEARHKQGN